MSVILVWNLHGSVLYLFKSIRIDISSLPSYQKGYHTCDAVSSSLLYILYGTPLSRPYMLTSSHCFNHPGTPIHHRGTADHRCLVPGNNLGWDPPLPPAVGVLGWAPALIISPADHLCHRIYVKKRSKKRFKKR